MPYCYGVVQSAPTLKPPSSVSLARASLCFAQKGSGIIQCGPRLENSHCAFFAPAIKHGNLLALIVGQLHHAFEGTLGMRRAQNAGHGNPLALGGLGTDSQRQTLSAGIGYRLGDECSV